MMIGKTKPVAETEPVQKLEMDAQVSSEDEHLQEGEKAKEEDRQQDETEVIDEEIHEDKTVEKADDKDIQVDNTEETADEEIEIEDQDKVAEAEVELENTGHSEEITEPEDINPRIEELGDTSPIIEENPIVKPKKRKLSLAVI